MASALNILNREVVGCTKCPRLVAYRRQVGLEKRRAYTRTGQHWARPVPGFGDPRARVLILGLAPSARSCRPAPAGRSPAMPRASSCHPSCTRRASHRSPTPIVATMD